jgi:hypothetical protein
MWASVIPVVKPHLRTEVAVLYKLIRSVMNVQASNRRISEVILIGKI